MNAILLGEPKNLKPFADAFFELYESQSIIFSQKTTYVDKKNRICRFCGKTGKENFKKTAHLLSNVLGNKDLHSYYECDTCNEVFARYESELAMCFSPYLSIHGVKGKRGTHAFTSNANKVRIENIEFKGRRLVIIQRLDPDDNSFFIDNKLGENFIGMVKGSYIPLSVYKAFVKMGISCMDETDVNKYTGAFKFLLSSDFDYTVAGIANIHLTLLQGTIEHSPPIGFLYKKKPSENFYPTHIFAIRFANCLVQLILPFNIDDLQYLKHNPKAKIANVPLSPPVFLDPPDYLNVVTKTIQLHNTERKKEEMQNIYFNTDPEALKQAVVFNHKTGKYSDLASFGSTKTIVMGQGRLEFTHEELKELYKLLEAKQIKPK
jgi:hypothetical protein